MLRSDARSGDFLFRYLLFTSGRNVQLEFLVAIVDLRWCGNSKRFPESVRDLQCTVYIMLSADSDLGRSTLIPAVTVQHRAGIILTTR